MFSWRARTDLSGAGSTHLAFRVLFGDLHGPRTGTRPAFQYAPRPRDRGEYQPVVEHHVEDLVHILEAFDLVLLAKTRGQNQQCVARQSPAYVVDWGEVYPVFQGISLELSVAVDNNLPVRVVDGNSLGIAMSGLAALSASALSRDPRRITHPSFMVAVLDLGRPGSCEWRISKKETKHTQREQESLEIQSPGAQVGRPGTRVQAS